MSGRTDQVSAPGAGPSASASLSEGREKPARTGVVLSDDATFSAMAQNTVRLGLWSWDPVADRVWYSTDLYRVHGVSEGGLGDRLDEYMAFVHPDDRTRMTEAAWAAATGDIVPLEYRFVHPEGGIKHLIARPALVRDRSGGAERLVGTVQDITEVAQAQRSVSQAFARVAAYFEEMPTPAYLWRWEGDDFVLRRFNKAAASRWGDRGEELLDTPASVLCADRPDIIDQLIRCRDTQEARTHEIDYESVDKGMRRLVVTYVPVAVDSVVAHTQDITELIEASHREAKAEGLLAEYFHRFPTPAYRWRAVGGEIVLEETNHAGIEATRGSVCDLIGSTVRELYVERPDIRADFERAVAGETFTREYRYELSKVGTKDLMVTYVHIPPDTVVAHTGDVTEQRRVEEELRQRESEMSTVIEGNPDGICLIVGGVISHCNDPLSNLVGYAKDDLLGRKLHDLMVPEDAERAQARGRAILQGGASSPSEYTLVHADGGHVPVEIFGAAFELHGEPALICTLRDIRDRKETERELAASRDTLRALTQHLESVREQERVQVARDLHDELGSVLTALKIDLADVVSADSGVDSELLDTMSTLLDQAIEVGRRVTARLRPGILDDLGLAAAAEWLAADLEKRTNILCTVVLPLDEPDLPDPIATAMFRILQEALTNVIRHAGAQRVRIELEAQEGRVTLAVIDDGVGFAPSDPRGAGFGLLGMRERVVALGGTLDIFSSDSGTAVRVALPVDGEARS